MKICIEVIYNDQSSYVLGFVEAESIENVAERFKLISNSSSDGYRLKRNLDGVDYISLAPIEEIKSLEEFSNELFNATCDERAYQ